MVQANTPPTVYRRDRMLTRVTLDDDQGPVLELLREAHVRGR